MGIPLRAGLERANTSISPAKTYSQLKLNCHNHSFRWRKDSLLLRPTIISYPLSSFNNSSTCSVIPSAQK